MPRPSTTTAVIGVSTAVGVLSGTRHWTTPWVLAQVVAAVLALGVCMCGSRRLAAGAVGGLSVLGLLCTRGYLDPGTQGPGMDLLAVLLECVALCACVGLVVAPTGGRGRPVPPAHRHE